MPKVTIPDVTFHEEPALVLTGFDHRGSYHEIGATFERLLGWAEPRGLIGVGTRCFGLYFDNPNIVAPQDLRAFAGLLLERPESGDGVRTLEAPSGRCAVLVHQGDYKGLEGVYRWLYDLWFPTSGHRPDPDRPCREEYLNNPRTLPPAAWQTRISAPVR